MTVRLTAAEVAEELGVTKAEVCDAAEEAAREAMQATGNHRAVVLSMRVGDDMDLTAHGAFAVKRALERRA